MIKKLAPWLLVIFSFLLVFAMGYLTFVLVTMINEDTNNQESPSITPISSEGEKPFSKFDYQDGYLSYNGGPYELKLNVPSGTEVNRDWLKDNHNFRDDLFGAYILDEGEFPFRVSFLTFDYVNWYESRSYYDQVEDLDHSEFLYSTVTPIIYQDMFEKSYALNKLRILAITSRASDVKDLSLLNSCISSLEK